MLHRAVRHARRQLTSVLAAPKHRRPNWSRLRPLEALEDRTVPTGVVTIAPGANAQEGVTNGSFVLTRTGDISQSASVTVGLSGSGTATPGQDFQYITGNVTFQPNSATATVPVNVIGSPYDDATYEPDETVILNIMSGGGSLTIGSPSSATVTITDNDSPPEVTVANLNDTIEGGTPGAFRFTRTGSTSQPLTVTYTIDGSATPGSDYTALSGTVTIQSGWSTADVTVSPIDDNIAEYDENVDVTIQSGTGYTIGTPDGATVIIRDNEQPVVMVEKVYDALEGNWPGWFAVSRMGDKTNALTVNFAVSGTATSGNDYTALGTSVTIAATDAIAYIAVDPLIDGTYDPDETVIVTLQSGTGYTLDAQYEATLTIADEAPEITVEKIADTKEGASDGIFRFTRTGDISQSLTVNYSIGGTALSGTDFIAMSGSVTFLAESATAEASLTPIDDSATESDETVVLTLVPDASYAIGESSTATVTIVDNERPVVSVEDITDATEGGATGIFRFSREGDSSLELTVDYTVGGTATAGTDYASLSGSVIIAAGEAFTDLFVDALDDSDTDPDETLDVTIPIATDYDVGTPNTADMVIGDNDIPPPNPAPVVGTGTGLFARYYNAIDLNDVRLARVDTKVDFNWGTQAPVTEIGADNVSVRWVGQVQAQFTENYKFHTVSDDGVRVWVNGQLVIDNWTIHPPTPNDSAEIALVAGQRYDIKVEYYEKTDRAVIQLLWSSANTPKQVIPQSQLYPVHFDLDVNANGNLTDLVDLSDRYMPGYEGAVQKVSTGTSFNQTGTADTYQGQAMKLVVNGIGTAWADVTKVVFEMTTVSQLGGYASNRTFTTNVGLDDYSFYKTQDQRTIEITRTSMPGTDGGGPSGGQMEANQTWVHFYAKDYGASARIQARIYLNGGAQPAYTIDLRVPTDTDGDGLADKWEIAMADRWRLQYGKPAFTTAGALDKFNPVTNPNQDDEETDPDGKPQTVRPLVDQKEAGDAHTVMEEYRGYILDGGGLDGTGNNGFTGGHIRLDPARKEILVEVDRGALNNLPGTGTQDQKLAAILNGASGIFSNALRGAGIYMYYVFDGPQLNIPKADVDTYLEIFTKLRDNRNPVLASDFMHLLLFDEGIRTATRVPDALALTVGRITTNQIRANEGWTDAQLLNTRGSAVGTTDVVRATPATNISSMTGLFMEVIAHELTHQLIEKRSGAFDKNEHTGQSIASLMYPQATLKNTDPTTVKITIPEQEEYMTKTGEWGTL